MRLPAWCLARRTRTAIALGLPIVAGLAGAYAVAQYGDTRYAAGRQTSIRSARDDDALVGPARTAHQRAAAQTDTIIRRITVTRWKVDTLLRDVPDSLRAVPEIAHLVRVTVTLAAQVDTLTRTLDVERAVSRLRASTDSAALVSTQLALAASADEIRALAQRPQWRTVALALGAGVVAGLLR